MNRKIKAKVSSDSYRNNDVEKRYDGRHPKKYK